jgi:hypothetical protein
MAGVYATIILAWQAGYVRLSVSVWAAALTVCILGLLACGVLMIVSRLRGGAILAEAPAAASPRQAGEIERPVQRLLLEEVDMDTVLRGLDAWPDGDTGRFPLPANGDSHAAQGFPQAWAASCGHEPREQFRNLVFVTCARHEVRET